MTKKVNYDLNSDHVIISIKIIHSKGGNKNKTPKINHKENYMKWRIQNDTNWEDFQKCLNEDLVETTFQEIVTIYILCRKHGR